MYKFKYHKPKSLEESINLFEEKEFPKYLSGGMTLIPSMKQLLSSPTDLIDIQDIKELKGIYESENKIIIGALTTHNEVAHSSIIKKNIKGSIVNITSIGAEKSFPNNPAYQSSKAALKHLTKSAAYDLSKYKIRVNSLAPGYTESEMNIKSWNDKKSRNLRSKHTFLNRWAKQSEISDVVKFLIEDKSSYINGSNIVVDGGWVAKGFIE